MLSDEEIARLLSNLEIAGYAAAMESAFAHASAILVTENHIKQRHRDLLIHSVKDERHRGA